LVVVPLIVPMSRDATHYYCCTGPQSATRGGRRGCERRRSLARFWAIREREGVEVLRGYPDMVAAVADSLAFEHKYRSIV